MPHSYRIAYSQQSPGLRSPSNEKLMPVDSMQKQEGRNAGPVHERPFRQSGRASCRARTHETCRVWSGAARWFVLLMNASERQVLINTRQRRGLSCGDRSGPRRRAAEGGRVMDVEIRTLNGGFGARTDHTGSHCPYGRSRAKIPRPATANSRNTTHWALTSRTTPIRPHTRSIFSITECA